MIKSYEDLHGIFHEFAKKVKKDQKLGHLLLIDPVRAIIDAGYEMTPQFREDFSNLMPELTYQKKHLYQKILIGQKIPCIEKVTFIPKGRKVHEFDLKSVMDLGKTKNTSADELGGYNIQVQLAESAIDKIAKMAYDLELFPHEYNNRYDLEDLKELIEELLGIQIPGGNWGDIAYVQISAIVGKPEIGFIVNNEDRLRLSTNIVCSLTTNINLEDLLNPLERTYVFESNVKISAQIGLEKDEEGKPIFIYINLVNFELNNLTINSQQILTEFEEQFLNGILNLAINIFFPNIVYRIPISHVFQEMQDVDVSKVDTKIVKPSENEDGALCLAVNVEPFLPTGEKDKIVKLIPVLDNYVAAIDEQTIKSLIDKAIQNKQIPMRFSTGGSPCETGRIHITRIRYELRNDDIVEFWIDGYYDGDCGTGADIDLHGKVKAWINGDNILNFEIIDFQSDSEFEFLGLPLSGILFFISPIIFNIIPMVFLNAIDFIDYVNKQIEDIVEGERSSIEFKFTFPIPNTWAAVCLDADKINIKETHLTLSGDIDFTPSIKILGNSYTIAGAVGYGIPGPGASYGTYYPSNPHNLKPPLQYKWRAYLSSDRNVCCSNIVPYAESNNEQFEIETPPRTYAWTICLTVTDCRGVEGRATLLDKAKVTEMPWFTYEDFYRELSEYIGVETLQRIESFYNKMNEAIEYLKEIIKIEHSNPGMQSQIRNRPKRL